MTKSTGRGRPQKRGEARYVKNLRTVSQELESHPLSAEEILTAELKRAEKNERAPMFSSVRTVYRYLNALEYLGVVEKKEGRWYPCQRVKKTFSTKAEKDDAWEHSKELLIGLEAILAEGRLGHSDALDVEAFPGPQLANKFRSGQQDVYDYVLTKVGDVSRIKQFAEEHLMTGYPLVHGSLEKYRKLLVDIRRRLEQNKHSEKVIRFVVDGIATLAATVEASEKWPWAQDECLAEDVREALRQKLETYAELESKIREIEHYVFAREPLDGQCQACKGIKVIE